MRDEDKDKFIHSDTLFFNGKKSENFFMQPQAFKTQRNGITEPLKRINDYDYNMLEESAYKDVKDETFQLEYKISKLEKELKQINIQIQTAIDMNDFSTETFLRERFNNVKTEYNNLKESYNQKSISTKISGQITSLFKSNITEPQKMKNNFVDNLISKLPNGLKSLFEIKKSIDQLVNITKNVDDLITSQIPYGECSEKYEQLSKYIIKANSIQNKISKQLKDK